MNPSLRISKDNHQRRFFSRASIFRQILRVISAIHIFKPDFQRLQRNKFKPGITPTIRNS